jgi:DNA-binding NarL/FixJ family response regulator
MNILIIEDDELLLEVMFSAFEDKECKIFTSYSIEDAYTKLQGIDIIICDSFYGKEFSFINFCRGKGIYCIYHTGRIYITDEEYYIFDCVIEKPNISFLFKKIDSLIADFAISV